MSKSVVLAILTDHNSMSDDAGAGPRAGVHHTYLSKLAKGASCPGLEIIAERATVPKMRLKPPSRNFG